jgi:hypothetical protein
MIPPSEWVEGVLLRGRGRFYIRGLRGGLSPSLLTPDAFGDIGVCVARVGTGGGSCMSSSSVGVWFIGDSAFELRET